MVFTCLIDRYWLVAILDSTIIHAFFLRRCLLFRYSVLRYCSIALPNWFFATLSAHLCHSVKQTRFPTSGVKVKNTKIVNLSHKQDVRWVGKHFFQYEEPEKMSSLNASQIKNVVFVFVNIFHFYFNICSVIIYLTKDAFLISTLMSKFVLSGVYSKFVQQQ